MMIVLLNLFKHWKNTTFISGPQTLKKLRGIGQNSKMTPTGKMQYDNYKQYRGSTGFIRVVNNRMLQPSGNSVSC